MTRRSIAPVVLAALAVVAAAGVVTAAATRDGERPGVPVRDPAGTARLSPRVAPFGSRVTAEVRVIVDPSRIDSAAIGVRARFTPFTVVHGPVVRRISGANAGVTYTYTLQCVAAACSRPGSQMPVALPPATVDLGRGRILRIPWPAAAVTSRLAAADLHPPSLHFETATAAGRPRIDPGTVGWTAVGAAVLLLLGLAATALRLRGAAAPAADRRSGVERALERLARARDRGQAERRAAIGELADALEHDGLAELAPLARRLAWSSGGPSSDVAWELGLLVRAALETSA
jgi:hypothetical protein